MTRQVLNHDDSVVRRHHQGLMALVEKPRPQRVRRICSVRGRAMGDHPRNCQAGKEQQKLQPAEATERRRAGCIDGAVGVAGANVSRTTPLSVSRSGTTSNGRS